jgi:hypothetical protein
MAWPLLIETMSKRFALWGWALCLLCLPTFASTVITYGEDWKYFLGTNEASTPANAWRVKSFSDAAWQSGVAPIGYANPANSEAEANLITLLPSSSDGGYLSVFLRKSFSVSNPAAVGALTLNVNVDDGFIVWLNGVPMGRYNMPEGEPTRSTPPLSAIEPTLATISITNNLASALVAGENVLAIQVFNAGSTSSDLFFDASLESDVDEKAPVVIDMTPAAGSIVQELKSIDIVFDDAVQGVEAADLLINSLPASSLTVVSPREYVFTFTQPANGVVNLAWAAGHGIRDLSGNPFEGKTWTVTLDTSGPPPTLMISEFLADNEQGIRDDDGTRSDWIELYNSGAAAVDLGGWFLTDAANNLTKWRFPAVSLRANSYLLVWASSKNRTNPAAQLHTNFKLGKDGGNFLGLVSPATNVVSSFTYPAQRADSSYGRDVLAPGTVGYFNAPTPGGRNASTGAGFAPTPVFSATEGVITNANVSVAITAPSGQIRYTTDGTIPIATSPLYGSAITLSTSTTIKARVFQTGLFPSEVIAKTFILVDGTVAGFKSKLPVMLISTTGRGIANHPPQGGARTFASIAALDTYRGIASPLNTPDYFGQAGISIRGQTSSGFPKVPYRLELTDANGNDRNSELFGLPSGSDWVLNNPYSDKPFLQNFLAQELFEKMGHYAVRRRFVEVFVNTSGGKVSYPRDYAGIYLLLEKIKIDKNRVEIDRLTPYDNAEPNISGGYMFKKDKHTPGDVLIDTWGGAGFSAQQLRVHEPQHDEITPQQYTWLTNYIAQFEKALYAANWKTATGTNHYSHYMDVDSFVDQHWIVEFAKQIDGYRLSNYFQKARNGKIKMEPIWDYNLSFGNANYQTGENPSGWYWTTIGENDHIWLRRLIAGTTDAGGTTGDPDFNQRIADRWGELRTNVFNTNTIFARVDEMAGLLTEAAGRDFARWPRLKNSGGDPNVWPNPLMYINTTNFDDCIRVFKTFIKARAAWIDTQFLLPPKFSLGSSRVPVGMPVSITGASTIYYTLDGTDPRVAGGGLSSKAVLYSGPLAIVKNTRLFARVRNGARWSGPAVASYLTERAPLALVEIMYQPAKPASGSAYDEEAFEFLEFKNNGAQPLNLFGYAITEGVTFTFPNSTLAPGARAVVVKNRAAFESRYGTALPVLGEYLGQLSNSGERLTVGGPGKELALSFEYNNAWHPATEGAGFALVLRDESTPPENLSDAASWQAGRTPNGTPGKPETAGAQFPQVVINEALVRPSSGWASVELQNLSAGAADISGWFLSDNLGEPKKYRFPAGSTIAPGGLLVVSGAEFQGTNALDTFSLNPLGEEVYLFSADANTNLTGYAQGFQYGAQATNATFGRHVTSVGSELFVRQISNTIGIANSGPFIPSIVINEIMYRPADVFTNGALWNNTEDEYVELFNRSNAALDLFDAARPTNRWKLAGDVEFTFPANTTIGANGYVLLVSFNPATNPAQLAAFRQKYQTPAGAIILGPYQGGLNNNSGSVRIEAPGAPSTDGTVPYFTLEKIAYKSVAPWPSGADGLGFSLARRDTAMFGNDPINWTATAPSAGLANPSPIAPIITRQPLARMIGASQTATFTVEATGEGALRYQWRVDGRNLTNATSATLTVTNAQLAQSGDYTAVVLSSAGGSTTSASARLVVFPDGDRDGMDDDWELDHGLNPFFSGDADLDPDGDGLSNAEEFAAGSDPNAAPTSEPEFTGITVGANATLRFRAAANQSYTVQATDSLTAPNWIKVQDVASQPTEFDAVINDAFTATGRFYRIVSPSHP